jgi:NAD(P)-dependent dehydrogenase (short-subunit alcohol dehydrogenase family)
MTGELVGKVALITGAASGIGRATAELFLAEGAQVVAGDINEEALATLASDECAVLRCDATSEEDQAALAQLAVDRFGRLDIAVANAGYGHMARIVDHTLDDWRRLLDVCLTGVYLTVQAAARVMQPQGSGSIVAMSSLNGIQPAEGMVAYCSAKAGVLMLTEVAALELGRHGIRVNALAPGLIQTPGTEGLWALPGTVEEYVENTALGRFAQPEEIAQAALFLASDRSSFMTGSTQLVDGGGHLRRYPDIPGAIDRLMGA